MSLFDELEKRIDEKLRGLFRSGATEQAGREIIEIQRFILDQIAARVQTLPRARRAFPFNDVAVRIPVTNPEEKPGLEMVFLADSALEPDVREYLRRDRVEFPPDLRVSVTLYDTAELLHPSLVFHNREKPAPEVTAPPTIRIHVGEEWKELTKARIHLGRLAEVLDDRQRTVRRNDVVVDDTTVSRAHARIEWHAASGEYRVFDDGSSYGTSILHEGRIVNVPPGGVRGIRLQPGDEIYLGHARLKVEAL